MRSTIQSYFEDEQEQQQQQQAAAGGQQQQGEDGDGDAAAAAAAAESGQEMLPWGVAHPVLRPSQESLLRQLRASLHVVAPRARDLGPAKFNGLVLARMLCGLGSPAVPQSFWKGCREFSRMQACDFRPLAAVADQVVREFWEAEAVSAGGAAGMRSML